MAFTAVSAQNIIPDGSFENSWYKPEMTSYDEYKNALFYTLNELAEEPEVGAATTFKSTDAHTGNYALKLVSRDMGWILIPGAMGTINEDFIAEFLDEATGGSIDPRKEFTFTAQPTAFEGWYKYAPKKGDSSAVEVGIYHNDELLSGQKLVNNEIVDEWTKFTIPFNYSDSTVIPNKVKILFVASAGYDFADLQKCKGQDYSTLYIDDIAFLYSDPTIGLREVLPHALNCTAYPIPATDNITLNWNADKNLQLVVYSITGAVVAQENVSGSSYTLNLSELESGNYFYRLIEGRNILGTGKFVVSKK